MFAIYLGMEGGTPPTLHKSVLHLPIKSKDFRFPQILRHWNQQHTCYCTTPCQMGRPHLPQRYTQAAGTLVQELTEHATFFAAREVNQTDKQCLPLFLHSYQ